MTGLLVLFALLVAACGSGFDTGASSSDVAEASSEVSFRVEDTTENNSVAVDNDFAFDAMADAEAPQAMDEDTAALTTGASGAEAAGQLPDIGRDIIYTATIELASTDVTAATREAVQAIEGRGGFLFSQETRGGANGSSWLTFKILPAQFHAALGDLGSLGTVRSQSISADDVTAVVVDLESRINTAEASVVRLRDLLDNASELETIARLENQLLQRETTLEQLRGQLRTVQNQVDLATITVSVVELTNRPSIALETATYGGHDAGFGCFDSPTSRSGEVGDPMTVCYRVTNTGDTPLVDLAFDDQAIGANLSTMLVVDGTPTQLAPGEQVLFAYEFDLEEPIRIRTAVTATALNADANPLADEVKATAGTIRFSVTDFDEGFPGFGEVLSKSWNALATVAIVFALVAVAIAPFLAVALVIGYPLWRMYRRNRFQVRPARPAPPAPPGLADESNEPTSVAGDADTGAGSAKTAEETV